MKQIWITITSIFLIVALIFSVYIFFCVFIIGINFGDNGINDDIYYFETTAEQEADKIELARYLYSQELELGRRGQEPTSYYRGKTYYERLISYRIDEIIVHDGPFNSDDEPIEGGLYVTVKYSIRPWIKGGDWSICNGTDGKNGWINNISASVIFIKEGSGYRCIGAEDDRP